MIVNSVSIETPYGFREFILQTGNIIEVEADLMILSSHTFKGRWHGEIVNEVENIIGKKFWLDMDRIISQDKEDLFGCGEINIKRSTDVVCPAIYYKEVDMNNFPDILLTRIHSPQLFYTVDEALLSYETSIKSIFASLAMLEFNDKSYRKISLPVIGGARKFPKKDIISIILKHALHWLVYSKNTNSVVFVVYDENDIAEWNEAMNITLGRTFEDIGGQKSIKEMQLQIKNIIIKNKSNITNKDLYEVLDSLEKELENKKLYIQHFGMFGRKIAEIISKELCEDLNIKPSDNPYSNIEKIENTKKIAKWINSYLHNLRVLGNEAVHVIESDYRIPEKLSQSDLLVMFSNILRIIEFYIMWKDKILSEQCISK